MDEPIEAALVDCSDGNQVIAKAPALAPHALQRPGYVIFRDQLCFNQQVA
jgi:hypothetical protein